MNLKKDQEREYENLNGTAKTKKLHGYTSTSLNIKDAIQYAGEYEKDKNYPVLLKMLWSCETNYYLIDGGAYNHEKEILLCDGIKFLVVGFD